MKARRQAPRTERLNLCLSVEARKKLGLIADRERRDVGYAATLLVEWAIEQYANVGMSFPFLWESKAVRDEKLVRRSKERLGLREEAQHQNESVPRLEEQRKRA